MIGYRLARASCPGLAFTLVLLSALGCKSPQAFGDRNSLIVRAEADLWARLDSTFLQAIERRVYTTRPERVFNVTHVAPDDTLWRQLRQWREVVVLGTPADNRVSSLARAAGFADSAPPVVFQQQDRWARGQTVTVLMLPEQGAEQAAEARLPDLYARLMDRYRSWVQQRMYASGVNDSLAGVLSAYGFSLRIPKVYVHGRQDSIFRFRNVYPDPGTLLRSLLVTWETAVALEPERLSEWRERAGETYYDPPQDVLEEGRRFDTLTVNGQRAIEYRAVWQDRDDFPAAGPLIARMIRCPGQQRTYYLDAWLYAPGKDKVEYLLQLETLLDTFECSEEDSVTISRAARAVKQNPI